MSTTEPPSPVSFCSGSNGAVEQLRSVQVAVKRLRSRDASLRHLWLQKGVLCTQAEGRDLFRALQHASTVPSSSSLEAIHPAAGSSIQSVRVCRGFLGSLRNIASWHSVIAVLSRLSNLEELLVDENLSVRDPGSLLDMLLLLHPRMSRLRRLQLNSHHSIDAESVPSIALAFQGADQLVEFVARDLVTTTIDIDLSRVVTSLSKLPNLATIDIGANCGKINGQSAKLPPYLGIEALRVLLQNRRIASITLRGFDFDHTHIEALVEALCTNTTLRHLHLSVVTLLDESPLLPLVRTMMDHQFTLQSLQLETSASESLHLCQLDALCALNRANRRAIVNDLRAPRREWIRLLWEARCDVNALFYLLLKNPCLCHIHPARRAGLYSGAVWMTAPCSRALPQPADEIWPLDGVIQVDV